MKLIKSFYFWILVAFASGCIFAIYAPETAILMEPLGASFIKLVKAFIGPIIFLTVAAGITKTGSLKKLGNIGFTALIYFEIMSSLALLIGWITASVIEPGSSLHVDINTLDPQAIKHYLTEAHELSLLQFFLNIIPSSLIEPFSSNNMLQILLIAILFGTALLCIGEHHTKKMIASMERITQCLFQIIRIIMYTAPIAVFGAMAYTVGKFGGDILTPLFELIGLFYLTGLFFVFVILGLVAKLSGFSIIRFLKYMFPELLLVLGTASSEAALPQLINKLETLGCQPTTVGVVVPMGYSFNLDGTNIYITLSALFIAQALGIHLTITEEFAIFATALLSSKGAAGVTGAGFVTLAATLSVVPTIPAVGIVLILGIDRFMSEARSLINYIGNGVGALVISRYQGEMSAKQLRDALG